MAWCEILMELGRGCRDIQQNLLNEDSYVVRKFREPCSKVSKRLSFLNDFLPQVRDPVHAWSIILTVFVLALAAISIDPNHETLPKVMKVRMHPPSASHILLPDGRYMAYHDQGVAAGRARFSLVAPHSFLSSRLAGAAVLAPMVNPYEPHMTKDKMKRTWEKWLLRRQYMYSLAYRFPRLVSFF